MSGMTGRLPAKGLSEAQIRTFLQSVLPAISKTHNRSLVYGRLHSLDSYAFETISARLRIVANAEMHQETTSSLSGLLKAQADDIWTLGLLCLALACGIRCPVDGIFGSRLRDGDISDLSADVVDLESELFDLIISMRSSDQEPSGSSSVLSLPHLPHISRRFADFLLHVLQSDWRQRPSARELLEEPSSFVTLKASAAALPSTLFPVKRPFQRRQPAVPDEDEKARMAPTPWSRLRAAGTSLSSVSQTRPRRSSQAALPRPSSVSVFESPVTRYTSPARPVSTTQSRRSALQDISNVARANLSTESIRPEKLNSPAWRDDTTLFADEEQDSHGHGSTSSIHNKPRHSETHFSKLNKLSRYARTAHRQAMQNLLVDDISGTRGDEAERRTGAAAGSFRIEGRLCDRISPQHRYSRSGKAVREVSFNFSTGRRREASPEAEQEESTWTDSVDGDDEEREHSSARTAATALSSRTHDRRERGGRNASFAPSKSAEIPMQSTPPRPSSRLPDITRETTTQKATTTMQPLPTLAQRRLVRRALGSPEMNAPWSSGVVGRSYSGDAKSTSLRPDVSRSPSPSPSLQRKGQNDEELNKFKADDHTHDQTRVSTKKPITPTRFLRGDTPELQSPKRGSNPTNSPFSVTAAEAETADAAPPPPLDLRGLGGIKQRTRYGKAFVLPAARRATVRGNDGTGVVDTVVIALRGEARGVGIQAEIVPCTSRQTRAHNGQGTEQSTIKLSVGALRAEHEPGSDVPGQLEKWHTWTLDPEQLNAEIGGSERQRTTEGRKKRGRSSDEPPDWVLRVYAHLCRWAQRRRQDFLQRAQAS
ncbi:hypothetical protein V8E36_009013 [Tilletia maclaganii]